MAYSTKNADKVMFSKGARVLVGAVDAAKALCTPVGLLGADASLNLNPTYRQKRDRFPQVIVAEAVDEVTAEGRFVLREWDKDNLRLALGLATSDVTDVAASTVNVVDEAYTVGADLVATIPHVDISNVVVKEGASTLTLNTDYIVVETPTTTLVVGLSGGDIADKDDLLISYDYTPVAHSILPIGKASTPTYYGVWIEEELTGSSTARSDYQIYKARIGLDGGFAINAAENGGDLPVIVQAVLASGKTELGNLYNYA